MKKQPKQTVKETKYVISEMEAKYRIYMNPDKEKFDRVKAAIVENSGYCLRKKEQIPENKCMCKKFLERDEECTCACGLYFKEKRTKADIEKYINTKHKFDEKKEKEVLKEEKKEKSIEDIESEDE